ncbi:MAG: diguanylate cyclase [Bacteroidales bacterium]|nr:diguanylate cyclase [Bacteroidales bacterium]
MLDYFQQAPISVTICDKNGKILEMSDKAVTTFVKDGKSLIGQSLLDCHPEPARSKLVAMLHDHNVNAYTIEKNGVKKLIYQMPWYEDGEFAGYIELSMEIPFEMPHFVRMPKQ